jgi:hypothetical protein
MVLPQAGQQRANVGDLVEMTALLVVADLVDQVEQVGWPAGVDAGAG